MVECPDVIEAIYGTDPLDPNSYPLPGSRPISGEGEADALFFSVLNTAAPPGPDSTEEADAIFFSVQNNAGSAKPTKAAKSSTTTRARNVAPPGTSPDEVGRAAGAGAKARRYDRAATRTE